MIALATLSGCLILSPPSALLDRASGVGIVRPAECAEERPLTHEEHVIFERALRSIVQENVSLSAIGQVTLEILPCRSELFARAEGEQIQMSLAFARFLLDASQRENGSTREDLVRFAVAHEIAHLVDDGCTAVAADAQLCEQSFSCELRADRLASHWQRYATSQALLSMARYAFARLREASRIQLMPLDPNGARAVAARRRDAFHHCVMAAELTARAAHVGLFEATRGDRMDSLARRDANRRQYDSVQDTFAIASDARSLCGPIRERANDVPPVLTPEDRADHEDGVQCMEQRYTALERALGDLEQVLAQPIDARAFMSSESRWTDDALLFLRAHGGIEYPWFQNDYQTDAGWMVHTEVGVRILEGAFRGQVGAMLEVSQFDARPPETSVGEPVSTVTATHLGLAVQPGIALLPPFAFGARLGLGWVRADFSQAGTIDGFFIGTSLFADWLLHPRFHLVLAGHLWLDIAEEDLYAIPLAVTLGFETYLGSH